VDLSQVSLRRKLERRIDGHIVTWILIVILFLQGLDVVLLPFFIAGPGSRTLCGWFMSDLSLAPS
jgi:hypothetical protein